MKSQLTRLAGEFPKGLDYRIVYDSSAFVEASVEEVLHTFVEALVLVLIVVFLFLQNWRTTLIPMLAVPVSLIATFAAFQLLGFTINTLSLFGMVLAIGIVVDDAIVVVEAVEHKMSQGLAVRDATIKAMEEVQGPVVAIALILAAVFIPMGFIPGVTGQLYKQFAVTVAVSTMFSALVALTLTPALCLMLLKPHAEKRGPLAAFFKRFNAGFDWLTGKYGIAAALLARRTLLVLLTLGILVLVTGGLFRSVPTGFVPDEDKGAVFMQVVLPDAASQERTEAVLRRVEQITKAVPGVDAVVSISGFDLISGTAASNGALVIVKLKPWDERTAADQQAKAIVGKLYFALQGIPEAIVMPFNPPALPGMGSVSGFSFMLQARSNQTPAELSAVAQEFIARAMQRPEIGRISTTFSASTPNYQLQVDREKAKKLGVPVNDVFATLQTFLGGYQVNDFSRFGRNYKVTMQAESDFRQEITDISRLFVRNKEGGMVPLDTLTSWQRARAPASCSATTCIARPRSAAPQRPARVPAMRCARSRQWLPRSCPKATASNGLARASRKSKQATPRPSCWACPSSSCSCSWRRSMRAGPCRSRCCLRRRSDSSVRCSRSRPAVSTSTSTARSAW